MAGPYGDQLGGSSPGPYGPQTDARTRRTIRGPGTYGAQANVRQIRSRLRAAGYHVDAGGAATSRLMSAWQHFRSGGNVTKWNNSNPHPAGEAATLKAAKPIQGVAKGIVGIFGKGKRSTKPVDVQVKNATKKAGKTTATHAAAKNASKKLGAGGAAGVPAIPGIKGDPAVNKLVPSSQADVIAGLQYDPQIKTLLTQVAEGKRDAAQKLADVGAWYGQVGKAQQKAAGEDTAAIESARGSLGNEINSIVQSLGGSRGAGVVGAQGLADLTSLAAQGASQQQYNADLGPILAGEQADQSRRQQAAASQAAQALNTSLVEAQGARGQAKAKALLDIIQANNQARQQNFSNRLAIQNAALAAGTLGLNTARVNADIAASKANTQLQRKRLELEGSKTVGGKQVPFYQLNYPDRQTVLHDAVSRAVSELGDPYVGGWDPAHVMNSALGYLRSGGYTSARYSKYKGGGVDKRSQSAILLGLQRQLQSAHAAYHSQAVKTKQTAPPTIQ